MPASLNRGELENHGTRMSHVTSRGNGFGPDQCPGLGSQHIKLANELVFTPLKVCNHLGHGQSSIQLVSNDTTVVGVLASGAGVCLQWLP